MLGLGLSLPYMPSRFSGAVDERFIFTIKTDEAGTSGTNQFSLPLVSSFNGVTAEVDWGDDTTSTITAYNQAEVTHTYSSIGTYEIKISNALRGWKFAGGGDDDKMLNVSNWGIFEINETRVFHGCSLLTVTATDAPIVNESDLEFLFVFCASITSLDLSKWDLSNATSLERSFQGLTSCNNINFGSNNFSNATNMRFMFESNPALVFDSSIGNWDVSNVDDMGFMFVNCDYLDVSLANWNINKVSDFDLFMSNASGLSTANYDATLVGWEATLQAEFTNGAGYTPVISINFGGSVYSLGSAAETARTSLINNFGWTITDGGGI